MNEDEFTLLAEIVKKCKDFGSPDLAAKFYLETRNWHNYKWLKLLISTFFSVTEKMPNLTEDGFEGKNLDRRVIPFLTTIANKQKLPGHVKIISWNYDNQIETGVAGLFSDSTDFNVWPSKSNNSHAAKTDYYLLHVNGIAGRSYSDEHLTIENPNLFDFVRQVEPLLSFAWEDDDTYKKKDFTTGECL